ncbi:pyridoxal-phosphate dependent enzyme [Thalassotalea sp. Y01]|uniref:1-aminocyclopropane-1-carboxylate deaminase/D-cysteine desulfhydrase n=1 Tax=Thalassotalea sp. Y01 TaxID=2729613 RepID=UPI00145DDD64|nr:pyridoxal-phosphate dependent enzyme [Thalassotalea sp. Y01]NMP15706.1 1-aminocyclopropane-1-carboxylate deaminase/D-cysteine desulfhydrase [Thalassotalea sp. Y01]
MSPLQPILIDEFKHAGIEVMIKRDDLLHPIISGNKWRKLKYNLLEAKNQSIKKVISFGGAYSNHIHALAYACKLQQLDCLGIIRGESEYQNNFTLSWARHWGMNLQFVDRQTYRLRHQQAFLQQLASQHERSMIIPEGGSNHLALPGIAEIIDELELQTKYDYLITPVGSGGTLAGLIQADKNRHQLLGISVLKQDGYLEQEVANLLPQSAQDYPNWRIINDHHCGGYGKFKAEHVAQIADLIQRTNIPFEPVYSGKMMLALMAMAKSGYFAPGSRVVLLHTGGLQGLGGLAQRQRINPSDFIMPISAPDSEQSIK